MQRRCPGGCPCPHHSGKPVARGKRKSVLGWKLVPGALSSRVPRQPITDQSSFFLLLPTDPGSSPSESYEFTLVLWQGGDRRGEPCQAPRSCSAQLVPCQAPRSLLSPVSSPGEKGQNLTFHHLPDDPPSLEAHSVSTIVLEQHAQQLTAAEKSLPRWHWVTHSSAQATGR